MRLTLKLTPGVLRAAIAAGAFAVAAGLSTLGAVWAVTLIERSSTEAVTTALAAADSGWTAVRADGLQLHLTGTAPTEAARFRALTAAGGIVDSARVIDGMVVAAADPVAPPRFSVEVLRHEAGISLIGLVPAAEVGEGLDRASIVARLTELAGEAGLADMLETAAHPVPQGWDRALRFGLEAVQLLPRAKISIAADRVAITAISDSANEQRRLERDLSRLRPDGLEVSIDISAPRPVITPFTLRFLIDEAGARFDACSADTESARDTILRAAVAAGMQGGATCTIGLGVPSPNWAEAAALGIAALSQMGGGALTFSDADVSLISGPQVTQGVFDRAVGDLEARLPDVFSLRATRPEPVSATARPDAGPQDFTATLDTDGRVQLRGRLGDARMRAAVDSYARAAFGADRVYMAARLDPDLPGGWTQRVFSGLEAMRELHHGSLTVQPDLLELRGVTGNPDASAAIARILSAKLGQGQDFRIVVSYDKAFDPAAALPTPQECAAAITAAAARQKIVFEPGLATFQPAANATLDAIGDVLRDCADVRMVVAGHTDAQGRDEMNLSLSQSRAEAVIEALRARRVLVAGLQARGFGETQPVADNDTPEGREANRRIEFMLIDPGAVAAANAATQAAGRPGTGAPGQPAAQPPVTDGAAPATQAEPAEPAAVAARPAEPGQTRPRARPAQD